MELKKLKALLKNIRPGTIHTIWYVCGEPIVVGDTAIMPVARRQVRFKIRYQRMKSVLHKPAPSRKVHLDVTKDEDIPDIFRNNHTGNVLLTCYNAFGKEKTLEFCYLEKGKTHFIKKDHEKYAEYMSHLFALMRKKAGSKGDMAPDNTPILYINIDKILYIK